MRRSWIIGLLLLMLCLGAASAQVFTFRGEVSDAHGEALAFVSVFVDEGDLQPAQLVLTDIEGRFSIPVKKLPHALTLRYVGFTTLRLDSVFLQKNADKPLKITLQEQNNELGEVEIRPGENPADRIIRLAVAHRDRHNPERRPAYSCTIYGKQTISTTTNWRGLLHIYANRDSLFSLRDTSVIPPRRPRFSKKMVFKPPSDHDDLLIESVVRRSFLYPDQLQQEVLQNRVSGFRDLPVAAIPDLVQPFTFHRDYIALLDKAFVNPLSVNSQALYFFNLEDTLYAGTDTVYVISFRPHRDRVFDALRGTLYINTDGWALQNVRAAPANQNSNLWLRIEQQYQRVGGMRDTEWFPEQLNFELAFGDATGLQLRATGHTRVTDVNFSPGLHPADFDPEIPLLFAPQANVAGDSAWLRWHGLVPLTARDERTFLFMDSLGKRHHFHRIEWITRLWLSEVMPLAGGRLGVDGSRIIAINDFEKFRIGLGLTTAQQRPFQLAHRFDATAWVGTGWNDREAKYGGSLIARAGKLHNQAVTLGYRHDLVEAGALEGWLDFRGGFDRAMYARTVNRLDEVILSLRAVLFKNMTGFGALRQQSMTPTYAYTFLPEPGRRAFQPFQFMESILSLRYAWGELANEVTNADWQLQQRAPVVEVIWTHGWKGLLGGQYTYERCILALYQQRFLRRLGKVNWRIEAGQVFGQVPLSRLFSLSHPGGDGLASAFAVRNTIQTADTLVMSDRFINLYFSQTLGNVLYRRRWSAPYLSLLQNAAWGDLRHPEWHGNIGFRSLQKPLFESGIRLDDLLRINILHFGYLGGGLAAFYGWGPYAYRDWRKNVAVRTAIRWSF